MDVNILNHLDKDGIILNLNQKTKKNIISAALDHLVDRKKIKKEHKKEILKVILEREEMGSTAIGGMIALPHARVDFVKDAVLCIIVSRAGMEFDSLDREPVKVVALLLSNQKEAGLHLKMLAFVARMLRDKYFVQQVSEAKTEEEVLALVNKQYHALK